MRLWFCATLLVVLIASTAVHAVDRNNFRKCDQASFCRRNRALTDHSAQFSLDASTLTADAQGTLLTATVSDARTSAVFTMTVEPIALVQTVVNGRSSDGDGIVRIRYTEQNAPRPRFTPNEALVAYDRSSITEIRRDANTATFRVGRQQTMTITYSPLRFEFAHDSETVLTINEGGKLYYEPHRAKGEDAADGDWNEMFKTHSDSKPYGPASLGVDVRFAGAAALYGIPQHATSMALRATRHADGTAISDPFRLYNLDVFEYELNNEMALYGSIPFMLAHAASGRTVGFYWHNAAETFVDVVEGGERTHWFSESGALDMFVLLGGGASAQESTARVLAQYASVTGLPAMPPLFAIAYHQCRWNYNNEADVAMVDAKMDDADIPFDVLWLDIEHSDSKKWFTWDPLKFPNPKQMQLALAAKGRKMVTIVDPHIKRDGGYAVHTGATQLGHYVKNKDGVDYDGHCWPGSSSWVDFLSSDARAWWASRFALDTYSGSTEFLYTWNDMNEPSVFSGPEITMHKDAQHLQGAYEHRDVHNIYGLHVQQATYEGLLDRSQGLRRPFVLSRAYFAGSQRFGAIWTGDNTAAWDHLEASVPMLLGTSLAGLPFVGADVGGFFGNPDAELMVRWYQAGAYQPFFRAHAHLDAKRREPYLFEPLYQKPIRDSIRRRYQLLPYLYTLFHFANTTALPVMRPLWMEYPTDVRTFTLDNAFLLGADILVHPVSKSGTHSVSTYLPGSEVWYDMDTLKATAPGTVTVACPLSKTVAFQRAGSIIPRKMRVRRSSHVMTNDPYTLFVALNAAHNASGSLYLDDRDSLRFMDGEYLLRNFVYHDSKLTSSALLAGSYNTQEYVERVVIVGEQRLLQRVTLGGGLRQTTLPFTQDPATKRIDIKKPGLSIGGDWTIALEF